LVWERFGNAYIYGSPERKKATKIESLSSLSVCEKRVNKEGKPWRVREGTAITPNGIATYRLFGGGKIK